MAKITEFVESNAIKTRYECDVLVAGGGIAGIAAALAAARSGSRVILLERGFMLGGLATAGLVTIYLPLCDGMGRQVSFGLAEELLRLSIKYGVEAKYPDVWLDREASVEERTAKRFQVRYNAQTFAIAAEQLLSAEGVKILYGTTAAAVRKENGKITHVVIESKSGREAVEVRSVVDATGDADICHLSGAECAMHAKGNVLAAWYYYFSEGKYDLKMLGFCDIPESAGGTDKVQLLMKNRFKGVDAEEISDMMRFSHAALLKNFCESYDKGENTSFIATIATTPQLRMTRRIVGAYTLDESEVHTRMDDSIGLVSDWRKRGPVFEIPFGTLWGRDIKNLITAGRCISVTDDMWDITRVIPDCAVTGEAAGVAAAMSDDFATLDIAALQNELRSRGVKIHETEV